MIRFIAHLLILSLLTLNIAWAVDACAFTDPADSVHVTASLQADTQTPVDPARPGLACDDWCHAWVGHVAVVDQSHFAPDVMSVFPAIVSACRYSSRLISPPFHPPIA